MKSRVVKGAGATERTELSKLVDWELGSWKWSRNPNLRLSLQLFEQLHTRLSTCDLLLRVFSASAVHLAQILTE